MKTKKSPRLMNDPIWAYFIIIILIPFLSFISLYNNDLIINAAFFRTNGLFSFNVVSTTVQIGLTGATLLFFVISILQQRREFTKMNKATLKSNDLQLLILEKQLLKADYNTFKSSFSIAEIKSMRQSICDKIENIITAENEKEKRLFINTFLKTHRQIYLSFTLFIKQTNAKIMTLKHSVSSEEHLAILTDAIGFEIMQILKEMYQGQFKNILLNYDTSNLSKDDIDYYEDIKYILQQTPTLKSLISDYYDKVGIDDYRKNRY